MQSHSRPTTPWVRSVISGVDLMRDARVRGVGCLLLPLPLLASPPESYPGLRSLPPRCKRSLLRAEQHLSPHQP